MDCSITIHNKSQATLGDTMKKEFKIGDLVEFPIFGESRIDILCLVVGIRGLYYRIQCIRSAEYYNTTEEWVSLPTYYPTPMGLPESPHTVIKSL